MNIKSVFALSLLSVTISAQATNGYFRLGYGQNSIAMGGTGTALAQDGLAGAINPATLFSVKDDVTLALSVFNPQREFTVTGASPSDAQIGEFPLAPGNTQSDSEYFLVPSFAYKHDINSDLVMSLSVYGNGGMNTDYNSSVFGAGETGVDLSQVFFNAAFAYRLTPSTQIGVAPIIGVQSFEARGVSSFANFSQDASKLSNNGHDTVLGYGARVGIAHQLTSNIALGASYQTEINFAEFDDYSGLFAQSGDFDVPSTYNLGAAYDNANFTVALDYQVINYSDIASVANPLLPNIMTTQLGSNTGAGFGWNDMEIVKLGVAVKGNNQNTFRAGVSYGEQPIDRSEVLFNILAPGVQEWHYTAGYEFNLDSETNYAVSFSYSPSKSVKGLNPLYQSQEQYIEIEMEQYEVTFAVSF
jgi:long-chain fatty acid transport protein